MAPSNKTVGKVVEAAAGGGGGGGKIAYCYGKAPMARKKRLRAYAQDLENTGFVSTDCIKRQMRNCISDDDAKVSSDGAFITRATHDYTMYDVAMRTSEYIKACGIKRLTRAVITEVLIANNMLNIDTRAYVV
jgi:hypothetical protein